MTKAIETLDKTIKTIEINKLRPDLVNLSKIRLFVLKDLFNMN